MHTYRPALFRRDRASRGFTLIELLTVIAIIGILAAILIPTVGAVRDTARNSKCVGNLRNLGQAMLVYANDNKGAFPKQFDNSLPQGQRHWYQNNAFREVFAPKTFENGVGFVVSADQFCPSALKYMTQSDGYINITSMQISYGLNTSSNVTNSLMKIRDHSRKISFGDSGAESMAYANRDNWTEAAQAAVAPGAKISGNPGTARRHKDKANVVFLDASVKSMSKSDLDDELLWDYRK